ncbi:hypothetical protein NQ176_g1365 [Zarea fungicola]|uniref:Uncharacterized protein n=1 Tax=Zarea fungicola TaxID=93591 RepID=A0ACC1NT37_9HYPO|nr:hypothetical protein NQ176_g1365 [Lecanicillium fungicola]
MLADVLGVSLHSFRRLHASFGTLAIALAVFHTVLAVVATGKLNLHGPKDKYALVFIPLALRNVWYEGALRMHQALSLAFAYAIWRHVGSVKLFPSLYIYVGGALFLTTSTAFLGYVVYRNRSGLSWARISLDKGTIQVRLQLSRPLKVQAGQYISLWLPSVSSSSFAQTHPFTITSWSKGPQNFLDFFIEPRHGFTKDLLALLEDGPTTCLALFSGPHGKQLPISRYENIVMLATEFGIAAHLSYLKQLMHDQRNRTTPVRRIHLVWQMKTRDVGIAAQKLLNKALNEDKLNGQDSLRVSMYVTEENIEDLPFGDRAMAHHGPIPLADIVSSELRERRPGSETYLHVAP